MHDVADFFIFIIIFHFFFGFGGIYIPLPLGFLLPVPPFSFQLFYPLLQLASLLGAVAIDSFFDLPFWR
jgi:hypothetical protein